MSNDTSPRFDPREREAGAAMARRALNKPERAATKADPFGRASPNHAEPKTTVVTGAAAREFGVPVAVGQRRTGLDGTIWTRTA